MRERKREHRVEDCGDEPAPAAERVPAERHEERHRADRDHAAEVIEHVNEGEAGLGAGTRDSRRFAGEECDQPVRLRGAQNPFAHRAVELGSADRYHA